LLHVAEDSAAPVAHDVEQEPQWVAVSSVVQVLPHVVSRHVHDPPEQSGVG
jgi:hypothetical protein